MTTNEEDNTPRILIVEDDERLAMLTQDYLVKNGLEVAIETDGNRAIRRIVMNNQIWSYLMSCFLVAMA